MGTSSKNVEADKSPENLVLEFIGPGGDKYNSLEELAEFSLSNYWSDKWPDNGSIIIPPVFRYQNHEISDSDIEDLQKAFEDMVKLKEETAKQNPDASTKPKSAPNPLPNVVARFSDEAEKFIYDTLYQMVNNGFQGPLIAIHNLNPNDHRHRLRKIFNVPPDKDLPGQFDFLLFGREIGIVAIEVKGGEFKCKDDFKEGSMRFPNKYKEGLDQLRLIHDDKVTKLKKDEKPKLSLLTLLKSYINCQENDPIVRKVLVTPNLQRSRYKNWTSWLSRKKGGLNDVDRLTKGILQLFEEDFPQTDPSSGKSLAEKKLCDFLSQENPISGKMYQAYGRLIVGIAAMDTSRQITLKKENISESHALVGETFKIDKIMLKTPEHLKAINGPRHQLILGTAGTGKTIILREKMMEIWRMGEKVTIVTPTFYFKRYMELYENRGFEQGILDYEFWHMFVEAAEEEKGLHPLLWKLMLSNKHLEHLNELGPLRKYLPPFPDFVEIDTVRCINALFKALDNVLLKTTDHLIIDDCLEIDSFKMLGFKHGTILVALYVMFYFAQLEQDGHPEHMERIVWIGINLYKSDNEHIQNDYNDIINKSFQHWNERFQELSISVLHNVMRSSKTVFKILHDDQLLKWPDLLAPKCGNSIEGGSYQKLPTIHCSSLDEVGEKFWDETKKILDHFPDVPVGIIYPTNGCAYDFDKYLTDKRVGVAYEPRPYPNVSSFQWHVVSSLEWSVVLYVTCYEEGFESSHPDIVQYQRFRAVSRAMVKVIELNFTVPPGTL